MSEMLPNGKHDLWSHRLVVASLGLTLLGSLAFTGLLALQGKPAPEGLLAIGTGALGALAGMLAAIMKGRAPD
jgi:hypothetical protein